MLKNRCKLPLMLVLNLWMLVGPVTPTPAIECLSPSYTVRQGKNYLDDVTPRDLVTGEYENLKQLFQWMDGDWIGVGRTVMCVGPEDGIREETESCTINSRGKSRSQGRFTLESHIYIQERRIRADQIHDFFLNERQLATSDLSGSDIELLNASASELTFVKKSRIKGAGIFTAHEWVVSFKKIGEASLVVEEAFFVNGRLNSTSIWRLERN